MRFRTALSIAGTLAASLTLAPAALATFPGDNGAIAFSRDGDVWTINPDGTGEKRLTSGPHLDSAPEWFPNGRELLFQREGDDGPHIYRMKADGTDATWVRQGTTPEISHDGKRFAFGTSGIYNVLIAGLDGSGVQQITHEELGAAPSDWSPINDLVLYQVHNNITWTGAISPEGAELDFDLPNRDPGPDYVNYRGSSWSPDGTRVALGSLASAEHSFCWSVPTCSDPLVGLIVTDLAGTFRVIRQGQAQGHTTTWSPDGTRIAYTAGQDSIKIIHPDGTDERMLTKGDQPDWQPLAKTPPKPPDPEIRTVTVPGPTVTVEAPAPPPVVITQTITRTARGETIVRTVGGQVERCVIPKGKKLTLTIRTTRAIKKGAVVKVTVDLASGKAEVARGKPYRVQVR